MNFFALAISLIDLSCTRHYYCIWPKRSIVSSFDPLRSCLWFCNVLLLSLTKFSKMVKFYIMEYQGVTSQYYYNYPKVQLANISYDSNNYFASPMNSRAGVATHDNSRYVASTNAYIVNGPHHIYIIIQDMFKGRKRPSPVQLQSSRVAHSHTACSWDLHAS